jgi:thiol:disulfide interchange protein DsbD
MSLPKPGAWMMGIKWVAGVVLGYMALKYLKDAFPQALGDLTQSGTLYGVIAIVLCAIALALGATHIAGERRRSKIAHLSKPMKLASILPAIAGLFMFLGWLGAQKGSLVPEASAQTTETPVSAGVGTERGLLPSTPKEIAWETDYEKAMEKASADHKPILVDFGASWCKSCKDLEEETFPDPLVRGEAARFVGLKVDATNGDDDPKVAAIGEKYKLNLSELPLIVLLDSQGNMARQLHGMVKPEKLVKEMQKVQ